MFTRTTPGQGLKTAKEPDSTRADWRTVMGRLRISSIDGVADLRWQLRRWGTGTGVLDEIEAGGETPQLVNARLAKLMMGNVNKSDKLDCQGMNRLQRTGTLPTVWIPSSSVRDARDIA